MSVVIRKHHKDEDENTRRGKPARLEWIPWKSFLAAAVPVALSTYYLTVAAPTLVPVPPSVKVPFPAATRFLEEVCIWTGAHPGTVCLIGGGLLLAGIALRFVIARYYLWLTLLVSLSLLFTYFSISAPTDRLLERIESTLEGEQREVPDFLPGQVRTKKR